MKMIYHIAAFDTKNKAMFLYSVLEEMGYRNFQVVSTPCSLDSGCNYAIKFGDIRYADILIEQSKELGIGIPDIYFANKRDGKYYYDKLNL